VASFIQFTLCRVVGENAQRLLVTYLIYCP